MSKDEIRKRLLGLVGSVASEAGPAGAGLRDYLSASIPTRSGGSGSNPLAEVVFADGGNPSSPAGPESDSVRLLREQIATLSRNIGDLRQTNQRQVESVDENTRATLANTGKSIASALSTAGQTARALSGLGSGLTLSPLVGGLLKLFGGKKQEEPPPLNLYMPPSPIRLDAAVSGPEAQGLNEVSYGQDGLPRRIGASSGAPPITIQVQAIDSRSFMDHSESIARAVREAMLNMHSLNDVITDL